MFGTATIRLGIGHILVSVDFASSQRYCTALLRESKKGATLTMVIALSILDRFAKHFTAAKSSKFPTKRILGHPPNLEYVAALPWKT